MKLQEAAKKGITRVAYVRDGKPAWNKYSFGDLCVFEDGTIGPWMKVYDPCGKLACGRPAWEPVNALTVPCVGMLSVDTDDQFEAYNPPVDMDRFPGCPPVPEIQKLQAQTLTH